MKRSLILPVGMLALTLLLENGCVVAAGPPGPPPPPSPVVEYYGPAPYPGAIWIEGGWRWHPERGRYEWHHGEWHHRG
ncbi:MAG TPA: hypothetical protein VG754_11475 [Verrucomicrobiae bacterium]|jgi:hypothetical protein|nr:hypothetical protein [Verrucomicrobiae bacterium]